MIAKLKHWWAVKKIERQRARFELGYSYAMTQHFRYKVSVEELESFTEEAAAFNTYDDFDKGIDAAVTMIRRLNNGC